MQYAVNFREVSAPVAPKQQRRSRNVCIGFRGVYLIAKRVSRRKTYFAEYSQQNCSFLIFTLNFPLTVWYGLIMHFCDSNHEITRMQQEEIQ